MSSLSKVFVTGATGRQGGAVARHLISNNFTVVALTRNTESNNALQLKNLGAQLVKGDLDNLATYEPYLAGVDGIYSVQTFVNGIEKEIQQGKLLVDAAKRNNIRHFVYSSVIAADRKTGIPHWDDKYQIEEHLKESGISYTILRPSSFYENLLIPQVLKGIHKGSFSNPLNSNTKQHMVAVDDIGRMVAKVFQDPQLYQGRVVTLATEFLTSIDVARILSSTTGRAVKHSKLPGIITRLFLGKNLHTMFKWVNQNHEKLAKYIEDSKPVSGDLSFKDWAGKNVSPVSVKL